MPLMQACYVGIGRCQNSAYDGRAPVVHPMHDPANSSFVHTGHVKKVSNMNYWLVLSLHVEH